MTRAPFNPVKPRTVGTAKAAVCELVAQVGGIEQVMRKLEIRSKSDVYAYTDEQSDKEMSFARVAALTGPDATAGVEFLAQAAGGLFLPMPRPNTPIGSLTAEAMRRHGKAAAALVEGLADGTLSAAEARVALPELESAVRALALLLSSVGDIALARGRPPP